MTIAKTAREIACEWENGADRAQLLELAILRHMEHHVAQERERCAKIADDLYASALADLKKNVTEDAKLVNDARQAMAAHIADVIRRSTGS